MRVAFELTQLRGEQRCERIESDATTTRLEGVITNLEKQLRQAHTALHKGGKDAERVHQQLMKEVQHLRDGRVWAAVREEEAKRRRIEGQRDELKAEVARLTGEVNARSRKHAAEMDELYTLRGRVKAL